MVSALQASWTPPPSLFAWFKYNEGGGSIILDYSPFAVNGGFNIGGSLAKFWSVAGFGHNDATPPLTWIIGGGRPPTSSKYASMVGFIKPRGADPGPWVLAGAAMWLGIGGATNWMKLGWGMVAPYCWAMDNSNIAWVLSTTPATWNVWHFIYMYSDTVANVTKLYTRISGGALTLVASAPHTNDNDGLIDAVLAFGANNANYPMDGGDMLWFTAADSSGVIGISQANNLYEQLKGRHGMS
jgi:hypothetical protein